MTYSERLKSARIRAKLSQSALASKAYISQAAISYLESGDAVGSEYTVQFAIICGVSPEWLATGNGSMTPITEVKENAPPEYGEKPTRRHETLITLFEGLTASQQDALIRELEETKQRNTALLEELLARRKA